MNIRNSFDFVTNKTLHQYLSFAKVKILIHSADIKGVPHENQPEIAITLILKT